MVKYTRTMTNIEEPGTYEAMAATIVIGGKVKVAVEPTELHFTKDGC